MTDNILYLDEQGYPCDDYRDIHEAIEETTKMLLSMTKAERIEWFRKSRYPYPINFDMEIGGTFYSGSPTNQIISGCGKENYEHKTVR